MPQRWWGVEDCVPVGCCGTDDRTCARRRFERIGEIRIGAFIDAREKCCRGVRGRAVCSGDDTG